jgi:hypothetical protein
VHGATCELCRVASKCKPSTSNSAHLPSLGTDRGLSTSQREYGLRKVGSAACTREEDKDSHFLVPRVLDESSKSN